MQQQQQQQLNYLSHHDQVSLSCLYSLIPPNPFISDHFTSNNNNNFQTTPFSQYNFQFPSQYHQDFINNTNTINSMTNPTCPSSNNSTSDEAEEEAQLSLIHERKQRRMISNRESARRSRMRKQKHLDELWSQVLWLRNENHHLVDRLNRASERHDRVVLENSQLKEEASELRRLLSDPSNITPSTDLLG